MIKFTIPEKLDPKHPTTWLASWFGFGFLNPAPGTWGSLGALPFGIVLYWLGGAPLIGVAAALMTLVGLWAADRFDKEMNGHDSKMIVIDEVVGQWLALIPAALNPYLIALAFILFRFFDITKPWPVSFFDQKVEGAPGVMGDDIVAGVLAGMVVAVLKSFLF